jgi:flagellar basal-body rod modification protein FlgD
VTTPLGAVGAASSTPSTTGSASDALDKDAFMKLLVAQLKYQNPMQPADGQQYMSQMAVFAQVEKLQQLVTAQQEQSAWQQRVAAEGLVGRTVSALDDTDATVTGVVTSVVHDPDGTHLVLADGTEVDPGSVTRVALDS